MSNKDTAIWGIHAGRTGDADPLFLKKNRMALGWQQMGGLAQLPADREAFKAEEGFRLCRSLIVIKLNRL